MRQARRIGFSLGVLAVIAIAASCREPTQITLRITTGEKCSDLTGVQIVVGPNAEATQLRFNQHFAAALTHECVGSGAGNLIGTLVVTPGQSSGTVVVSAGVSQGGLQGPDPGACADVTNTNRCIIARRSFSFIEHTSLTLPIDLDPLCVGKACDPASTCFKGSCVSDTVACADSNCGLSGEVGSGSGADASSSDGAYDADRDESSAPDDAGDDVREAADSGSISSDAGPDAAGRDAGSAVCGNSGGFIYCYGTGPNPGASSTGVTTSGTCANPNDKSTNCCTCTCKGTGVVESCDVMLVGSGSCHPMCM